MRLFPWSRGLSRSKHCLLQFPVWLLLIEVLLNNAGVCAESSAADSMAGISHGRQYSTAKSVTQFLRRSVPLQALAEIPEHSQCALVHNAKDQCAWILENCDDQDSGLISYLELYYCRLPQAKPVAMTIIIVWLAILFSTIGIAASDYFCVNLSTISTLLGLSESLTGVTFLAFGNGSPDVFSTWAAMSSNSGSLAIGELIGAAGFITAIVVGSMAIVRPFKVAKRSFIRDLGFFIVATAFSLSFLVDGHLELWECILMVAYYVFYVCFVIVWHWRSKRQKARKAREVLSREHFLSPEYRDNPADDDDEEDEDGTVGASRNLNIEDEFTILERSEARNFDDDNEDDDTRDRLMAELTTSMRLTRPRGVSRENTRNTIRPSLVGALEFRAVLSSLERSRSQLSIPLYMRRYSDDAVTSIEQQHRLNRANSDLDPIAVPPPEIADNGQYRDEPLSARPRAVSTNDLNDPRTLNRIPLTAGLSRIGDSLDEQIAGLPRLSIPVDDERSSREHIQAGPQLLNPASAERTPQNLSPISNTNTSPTSFLHDSATSIDVLGSLHPSAGGPSRGDIGTTQSPPDNFVAYRDDLQRGRRSRVPSFSLPRPILQGEHNTVQRGSARWWPYRILPEPEELFSILFPTLCNWSQKSWAQRTLALITVPSVFVLNITLPVVETVVETGDEKDTERMRKSSTNATNQGTQNASNFQTPTIQALDEHGRAQPAIAVPSDSQSNPSAGQTFSGWNRWLLCTQLLFAPSFVITTLWANFDADHDVETILLGLAVGLLFSLVAILAVLLTSNEKVAPRYRPIFCTVGFAVSVSWISTIANEVVGILKALGIVLNISEAILGLTVFAVGSSLGDLVADITIARLGYPMMALSACFGGPMLNILLGIGVGGIYLLLQRSDKYHHKHPDRPIRYKSYHIEIDRTLVVSSVALLITLIGLAIAVPLNGWRMSRRIGWTLIAIWVIATGLNLGIEIGGYGKAKSS